MKKNLRYFMTLLLMMVASVGWAESKTEGFEAKTASTTYNSTVTVSEAESDCGIGWSIYYGTVSTNDKISGSKSAQMRWYSSATDNYPYMMSTTPVNGLTNVGLKARTSSLDVKMDISYSADGETWTVGTTYTFNATGKGEAVSLDIPSGNKYVKFGVSSSSTAPTSSSYKLIVDDVVFTYENASSLQDPGLAFASSEQTITLGDPFTLPELTNNGDGTVTFTSSNTAVATIDSSTGEVEVLKAGKTVFTASSAETETYNAGRATFTLTVNPVPTPIEDGVFDFTGIQAYGTELTPKSDNSYIEETKTWTAGNVTLVTSGKYRWWYAEDGNTLRVYEPSEGNTTLTLSVPEGNVISQIVITGNSDCKTLVSNIGTYDTDNYTWTGQAQTVVISRGDKNAQIKTITVTYGVGTGKQDPGLAFSSTTVTANIGETFTAPTLSYAEGFDGPITYSSSKPDVATVDATGAVTIKAAGTTTITATFEGNDSFNSGSASYELTVVDPNAPGSTAENPYTVAQARAAIDANTGIAGVYATGIVSQVDSYNSKYYSITYWISADGTTTSDQLEVYSGKGIGGENFNSENDIQVGDVVTVYGNLKKYNTTYEFDMNNQLVSLTRPEKPAVTVSFNEPTTTVNVDETVTNVAIADVEGVTVVYSSSDTSIATVNGEGVVTGVTAGTATITATIEEAANYDVTVATYEIQVIDPSAPVAETYTFNKITSTDDLVTGGEYIIVCEDQNVVMAQYGVGTAKVFDQNAIQIENNSIEIEEGKANILTLGGETGAWTFATSLEEGNYLGLSSSSNALNSLTEGNITWSISFDDNGNCVITSAAFDTRTIRYNSGSPRFACYTTGQKAIQLYKKVSDTPAVATTIDLTNDEVVRFVDFSNVSSTDFQSGPLLLKATNGKTYEFTANNVKYSEGLTFIANADNHGYISTTVNSLYGYTVKVERSGGVASIEIDGNSIEYNELDTEKTESNFKLGSTSSAPIITSITFCPTIKLTVGETGYATIYYSDRDINVVSKFGEVLFEASTYKLDENDALVPSKTYGFYIPHEEAVVLKGEPNKDYLLRTNAPTREKDADNLLKGSDVEGTTTGGSKYYALATNADGDADSVGFYWQAEDGGAFTNGAHKAYLALPAGEAKSAYLFSEDISTGINGVNKSNNAEVRYNMQGQRVGNAYKGVVIKNGKKFLQK